MAAMAAVPRHRALGRAARGGAGRRAARARRRRTRARARAVADPRRAAPRASRDALQRAGDRAAVRAPGRGAARARGTARRSSRPAPPRASRCASTCRRSTCSAATPRARALYLYPTKALAQDQARALHALGVERARPAIYDGDTPREQRTAIRRTPNVVLTNPDMLHLGILPNHRAWGELPRQPRGRRRRRGARLPRRLRLPRRATCCGGCAGSPPPTGPSRASCSRARRSRNPVELAERLTGLEDVHA